MFKIGFWIIGLFSTIWITTTYRPGLWSFPIGFSCGIIGVAIGAVFDKIIE